MSNSNFVQAFVARLDGKVSTEEMRLIANELEKFTSNFDISTRQTALTTYADYPYEYKIYMVTKKMSGLSDKTLKLYKLYLEHFFDAIKKPLRQIETNDIRLYLINTKEQRRLCDRSLDGRRLALNGFFNWCANERYIDASPMASIDRIKFEVKPREPFTDIEMVNLRYGCETARDRAMVEVFYSSACRCAELGNLKKSDINWTERRVKLFGKGKKHRVSLLSADALVALKKYLDERDDDNEALFVSMRKPHKALGNAGIEKAMKKIGARVNVDKPCPHRLRHTFATDAHERGMELATLQYLLGHSKPETTMIYVKQSASKIEAEYHKCIA